PLRAPDNFLYDKPPEQWKTDKVDVTYGHVLGYQTCYYSSDLDAEGHMFHIVKLMHSTEINEKLDQPKQAIEQSDPALFREVQHRLEDPDLFLELFKIPKALYDYNDEDHDVYAVHSLSQFIIKTNHIISAEQVMSGRMGIYTICLCVLAIAKLIHEMEEGVVVLVGGQFLLTWESCEGQALESIIDTIIKGVEAVTNSTSCPQVFQGALSSPWRPKHILYQREGAPEDLKIEWPYGDWGTNHDAARLAGLLKSPTMLALTDSKCPSSVRARHQLDAMPTVDATGAPPAPPDNTASSLPLI
ncbi:hypothetical protein FRC11_003679, partial [Ceratobasidium sp. 423]